MESAPAHQGEVPAVVPMGSANGSPPLVGVRVPVVALLGMAAPDRRPDGFDDDDLAAVLCAHAKRLRYAPDWRVNSGRRPAWERSWESREAVQSQAGWRPVRRRRRATCCGPARTPWRPRADEAIARAATASARATTRPTSPSRPIFEDLAGADVPRRGDHRGHGAEVRKPPGRLGELAGADAILSTTTSSLSVSELAVGLRGIAERFVGLHVFNPVPRMKLVELAYPDDATDATRERARTLCEGARQGGRRRTRHGGLRRQPAAVSLPLQRCGLHAGDGPAAGVDRHRHAARRGRTRWGRSRCWTTSASTVCVSIGDAIWADVPESLRELCAEGALGRKAGRGPYPPEFYAR